MKVNLDVGSCVDGNGAGDREREGERDRKSESESERVYIFGTPVLNFQANGISLHSAPLPSTLLLPSIIRNYEF